MGQVITDWLRYKIDLGLDKINPAHNPCINRTENVSFEPRITKLGQGSAGNLLDYEHNHNVSRSRPSTDAIMC